MELYWWKNYPCDVLLRTLPPSLPLKLHIKYIIWRRSSCFFMIASILVWLLNLQKICQYIIQLYDNLMDELRWTFVNTFFKRILGNHHGMINCSHSWALGVGIAVSELSIYSYRMILKLFIPTTFSILADDDIPIKIFLRYPLLC